MGDAVYFSVSERGELPAGSIEADVGMSGDRTTQLHKHYRSEAVESDRNLRIL